MTVFSVTHYKWMDNVICLIFVIYYKHNVPGGQFNVFRHLKMHKSAGKPK